MHQLILDLLPENPPSLDNFVPGENTQALAMLAAWKFGKDSEPFMLLWGESGSGKTHLLRACASEYHDATDDPDLTLLEKQGNTAVVDGMAIDNIEVLSSAGQIVLFDLFNHLRAADHRLLAAASQPPLQLSMREDLRTRLGSGLTFRLIPLSDQEKMRVLSEQAQARKLPLPPGALDYLLTRAPRDMRCLMACLAALDRYSLEHKRPITFPLLRDVLQHIPL